MFKSLKSRYLKWRSPSVWVLIKIPCNEKMEVSEFNFSIQIVVLCCMTLPPTIMLKWMIYWRKGTDLFQQDPKLLLAMIPPKQDLLSKVHCFCDGKTWQINWNSWTFFDHAWEQNQKVQMVADSFVEITQGVGSFVWSVERRLDRIGICMPLQHLMHHLLMDVL